MKGKAMIINILLMLWTVLSMVFGITVYNGVEGPMAAFMLTIYGLTTAAVWWFKCEYEK